MIVTGKNEKNVVRMNMGKYNHPEMSAKNAGYLKKLNRSMAQLEAGRGQEHDLLEDD